MRLHAGAVSFAATALPQIVFARFAGGAIATAKLSSASLLAADLESSSSSISVSSRSLGLYCRCWCDAHRDDEPRPCVGRARRVPFWSRSSTTASSPPLHRVRCRRVAFRGRFHRRGLRVSVGCHVGRALRVPIACGRHGVDRHRDDCDRHVDHCLPGGTNGSRRVVRVRAHVSSDALVQCGALRACRESPLSRTVLRGSGGGPSRHVRACLRSFAERTTTENTP